MVDLPFEIWCTILSYLSPDATIQLRNVCSTFLEIARKLQYQTLVLNGYREQTKRLLRGLSSLPLGHHVRSLRIEPWAVSSIPGMNHHRLAGGRLCSVVDRMHSFFDPAFPAKRTEALVCKRTRKQIQLVIGAAQKLTSVGEFCIDWDAEKPYSIELLTAFLSLIEVAPFRRTLTRLRINVPIDRLVNLAPVTLPALLELDFHLVTISHSERYIDDCLDCFVVFVNNLYPTLQSLAISSSHLSYNLNLSSFFHNIGFFPYLHSFAITIPYDGAHLSSNPHSETKSGLDNLVSFICKHHRTIQELKLLACPRSTPAALRSNPIHDPNAKYWIQRILADIQRFANLGNLCRVELALRPLTSDLKPFLSFISSISQQLDSIALDGALSANGVGCLVDVLSGRVLSSCINDDPIRAGCRSRRLCSSNIRHLSLTLRCLSPYILDLLASNLSSLQSLKLKFYEARYHYDDGSRDSHEELGLFIHELRTRRNYSEWAGLSSLAISRPSNASEQWCKAMEDAFIRCIPGLTFFNTFAWSS